MERKAEGFADLHSHFLYGLDDGAKTRREMEAMLDAAYADGIAHLYATPHAALVIRPFDGELCARRLEEARAYCRRRGYEMRLYGGAELMYTPAMERFALERRLPTLGDSRRVLMEFVPDAGIRELREAVELVERSGYTAVLAHVERYHDLDAFLADVDLVVVMVKHNEIMENVEKLESKIVLDCHDVIKLPSVYHL